MVCSSDCDLGVGEKKEKRIATGEWGSGNSMSVSEYKAFGKGRIKSILPFNHPCENNKINLYLQLSENEHYRQALFCKEILQTYNHVLDSIFP